MEWDASKQDQRLLAVHRRLGALRRELPVLRHGAYERLETSRVASVAAFARDSGEDRLVVVANAARETQVVSGDVIEGWLGGRPDICSSLAYTGESSALEGQGLRLPAQSVSVIRATSDKVRATKGKVRG
jgi:glycosidase